MTLAILLALLRTASAFAADSDGDGYIDAVDCDPTDPAIHPKMNACILDDTNKWIE